MGTLATKVIGLAFEGISSFLHHKRHKALQKAINALNSRTNIDHNRVYHLEDTMIMYGKYNSDTLMALTTVKEKYVRMYEKFSNELRSYSKAIQILSKGYLPITLITQSKLKEIPYQVQLAIAKLNQDYEIVLNRLYMYYDMKLVMICIDSQKSNHSVSSVCPAIHTNKTNFIPS